MKQRRALSALGILIVVLAALALARLYLGRGAPDYKSVPSARSLPSAAPARSEPKPPPLLSASAPESRPARAPAPPYLDTTATTLAEQRSALFTNMQNQLDLPDGALAKIEAIFKASN